MNICKAIIMAAAVAAMLLTQGSFPSRAQEKTRYIGGEVTLKNAPNGALGNAAVLEVTPKIAYLEPVTEKVADGVWCIGGHLIGNTTVIEADDGLIVYDTGENREEGEHARRGVVEYVPVPADYYKQPDYVLELDSESWAALYLGSTSLQKAVAAGRVKLAKGDPKELVGVFDLFDKFDPNRNAKIPPLEE